MPYWDKLREEEDCKEKVKIPLNVENGKGKRYLLHITFKLHQASVNQRKSKGVSRLISLTAIFFIRVIPTVVHTIAQQIGKDIYAIVTPTAAKDVTLTINVK